MGTFASLTQNTHCTITPLSAKHRPTSALQQHTQNVTNDCTLGTQNQSWTRMHRPQLVTCTVQVIENCSKWKWNCSKCILQLLNHGNAQSAFSCYSFKVELLKVQVAVQPSPDPSCPSCHNASSAFTLLVVLLLDILPICRSPCFAVANQ